MRTCYLAAPYGPPGNPDIDQWPREASEGLVNAGFAVMRSADAATASFLLDSAVAVMALLPPGAQSLGVPMAIEYARLKNKPLAVVFDLRHAIMEHHGIRVWGHRDMSDAIDWLDQTTRGAT